ncbi:uncharacterized protein G2W53_032931 [Senna tora]|uniref:Uncharacterized protein n=1 Tax=Senna tora TaxID=362788 RepID=A0A834W6P6_9FABA|nr:uncharacterized protein G2W53_032931 [Senna tora]
MFMGSRLITLPKYCGGRGKDRGTRPLAAAAIDAMVICFCSRNWMEVKSPLAALMEARISFRILLLRGEYFSCALCTVSSDNGASFQVWEEASSSSRSDRTTVFSVDFPFPLPDLDRCHGLEPVVAQKTFAQHRFPSADQDECLREVGDVFGRESDGFIDERWKRNGKESDDRRGDQREMDVLREREMREWVWPRDL